MQSRPSAIVMYHSLDRSGSPVSITPEMFRAHMRILAEQGIPVVPLGQAANTPGSVALTFDDAFRNFSEHALPELARHRFPATVFAVSGFCGRTNDWPGQPAGIPILPLMSWSELRDAASAGVAIGAHTVTHPRLDEVDEATARREIEDSAREIQDRLGLAAGSFAYPYGAASRAVRELVDSRFEYAVSTELDYASAASDPHWLPRVDAYYFQSEALFRRLFSASGALYLQVRRGLRSAKGRAAAGSVLRGLTKRLRRSGA